MKRKLGKGYFRSSWLVVGQRFCRFAVFFFEIESCVPSFLAGDCFNKIETPRVLLLVVCEVIGTRIGGLPAVTNDTHS